MKSELEAKITSSVAIFVFVVLAVFKGQDFFKDILSLASTSVTWTVILRSIYVRWLWKMKLFRWIHKTPCLEGRWIGEYQSTGNANTPPDRVRGAAEVEIRQPTIHSVKIIRRSHESVSRSYGEEFLHGEDGIIQIAYSYRSEPNADIRERSPISYGSARLTFVPSEKPRLEGDYWTDQKTTGTIRVERSV